MLLSIEFKMAREILSVFYIVTLATILQSHLGATLHVEVDPENFNEVVTDELVISCLDNGTIPMVKQVVMLELWKKDESPLVIVREDNLTSGPGIRSNMKATGHVQKDASRSYLKLTIKNPGIEDAGTYSCKIFYLNDLYQLKEASAFGRARVTVDKSDITDVVTYLMGKLNILEKTTKQQEELIAKQSAVIQGQDSTLKRQEQQLMEHQDQLKKQVDKDKAVDRDLNDINYILNFESRTNADQEARLKQCNDSIKEQAQRIGSQERQLMEQEQNLMELVANATYTTAFSYRYNPRNKITNGNVIIFSDRIMDIGNDYNTNTGKFTAPRDGFYSFHITARTYTGGIQTIIDLYHNTAVTARLYASSYSTDTQSSTRAAVSMKEGDTFFPQLYTTNSGNTLYTGFDSKFTGHLIRLL